MVEQVGLPNKFLDEFVKNVHSYQNLMVTEDVVLIHMEEFYISSSFREMLTGGREQDIVWGLLIPVGDAGRLGSLLPVNLNKRINIYGELMRVIHPICFFRSSTAHISIGMDEQCLVMLSSWWSDQKISLSV